MQPTRLFDFIYYQQQHHPNDKAYARKAGNDWLYYSTQDVVDQSLKMASGLLALGLQAGDKIAMVSYKNSPEWFITDLASQQAGLVNVPLYPTISAGEYEYILNEADVKYVFVGPGDLYDKVAKAKQNVPSLKGIYTFERQEGQPFWEDMWTENGIDEVKAISDAILPEELATIIYTSGTTGHPKGVMLTHSNIVYMTYATADIANVYTGESVLSFLPLCHIFERAASFMYTYKGISVYFTGTDNLGGPTGDLQLVKPYFFTTVPRLLEKVYESIYNKGLELSGVKRKLFFWALSLTDDYEYDKKYSGLDALNRRIADRLIFSKWRAALGGNVRGILTGAAPCPAKIMRVFSAAGIAVREAYGLTETSPGLTGNRFEPNKALIGTVGPVFPDVKIYIDSTEGDYAEGEGEILATGPNIMVGYYKKPEQTEQVFKVIDGIKWFRTGDVGKIVKNEHGVEFLKITDRKKELLKTSGGKYVAPAPIESRLKEDFLVEQAMVVGDSQKFVSVLIVPATQALKDWCKNNNIEWTSQGELIKHPKVLQKYQEIIDGINPEFGHIEQVKKFRLLDTIWDATKQDQTEAELTPTMKLKRRVILDKFKSEIEAMYV
jgi:long-chain acyl-CoA synthetase